MRKGEFSALEVPIPDYRVWVKWLSCTVASHINLYGNGMNPCLTQSATALDIAGVEKQ